MEDVGDEAVDQRVVKAEEGDITQLATLDRHRFSIVTPAQGSFHLLP